MGKVLKEEIFLKSNFFFFFAFLIRSVFHAAALVARAYSDSIPRCIRIFVSLAAPLLVGLGYESSQPFEVTESERRDAFAAAFERMIRICYNSGDCSDVEGGVRGNPIIVPPHNVAEKMIQVILEVLLFNYYIIIILTNLLFRR